MIPLPLIVAFVAAAVGTTSGYMVGLTRKSNELNEIRDYYAKQREAAAANSARWEAEQRNHEMRRIRAVMEVADAANIEAAAARSDAAQLERTAGVLRSALVAAYPGTTQTRGDTAAASSGTSATGPGLVLSDLFGGLDPQLRELAAAYDQARAAGLACERAYAALTP